MALIKLENAKKTYIIVAIAVIVIAILWKVDKSNDARTVFVLPPEYIPIDEVIMASNGRLQYIFWETQISFLDSNDVCIYQTSIRNADFILKYRGAYYIKANEEIGHFIDTG